MMSETFRVIGRGFRNVSGHLQGCPKHFGSLAGAFEVYLVFVSGFILSAVDFGSSATVSCHFGSSAAVSGPFRFIGRGFQNVSGHRQGFAKQFGISIHVKF